MAPADERWFTELFERWYPPVLAYARRRAPEAVAREVAADTFLVAWRRPDRVPADPLPWLYGVARNVLAQAQRREGRQQAIGRRAWAARSAAVPTPGDDPADSVPESQRIVHALRRLSPLDQEALQLVAWEDLDVRTAAAVAGCSPATFRVRLHRARVRLQQVLEEPPDVPDPAGQLVPLARKVEPR